MNSTTPMHLVRPRVRSARNDRSPDRIAVENALQFSAPESLTSRRIATICDLPLKKVATILCNLRAVGDILRTMPTEKGGEIRYAWCRQPPAPRAESTQQRRRPPIAPEPGAVAPPAVIVQQRHAAPTALTSNTYDGRDLRPYTGRPGSLHAFTLPSIQNGQRVDRRPPMIMGCTPPLRRQQ